MANYEELKKEFLAQRSRFSQCEESDRNAFQDNIEQYLINKTPEEVQMITDIMLKSVNEDIDKTNNLIREVRLRKVLSKVYDAVSWSYIAKTYFGKSRSWLNQCLNSFMIFNWNTIYFNLIIINTGLSSSFTPFISPTQSSAGIKNPKQLSVT